ncbi:MAG: GNAT family N-acetyltransferase, partial [Actinomycetota bacterium]|nr:GNAT family N-acetyltransferase [Actinomycetota bacterium]
MDADRAQYAEISVLPSLDGAGAARVRELAQVAADADGVRPLGDHVMLALRYGGSGSARHLLAVRNGRWVGYGHLDLSDRMQGASAEVVVHPEHRRRGVGRALVEAMLAEARPPALRLWAHGHR